MESLHLSFSRAIDAGLFTGIKLDSSLSISHLFYADNVVFIGEWSNVSDNRVFEAALTLGCSVMKYPFKYLGVRVGDNMSLVNAWDETVMKLRKRLTRWKLKTLSIGGRLTLLKSVLGSSPIYNMSLFKAPKSHMFPRLFALESAKDSYVAEKLDTGISASFRRTVRGGAESYQLDLLLNLLEPISLSSLDDRWVCDLNGDGEFLLFG
ncbi:hypothetical protein Tco_0760182 [Tanacetum coccineum]